MKKPIFSYNYFPLDLNEILQIRMYSYPTSSTLKKLQYANLSGFELTRDNIGISLLSNRNLYGADMVESNFYNNRIKKSNMEYANFNGSNLVRAKFKECNLQNANFENTNLNETRFLKSDLRGVSLFEATVIHAEFTECDLEGVDFSNCVNSSSHFTSIQRQYNNRVKIFRKDTPNKNRGAIWNSYFTDCNLQNTNFSNMRGTGESEFGSCDMRGANLSKSYLGNCFFKFSDLRGANLAGADLRGAKLNDCDLRDANLSGALLSGANLEGATLDGANLENAVIDGETVLISTDFRGAKTKGLNWEEATIIPSGGEEIAPTLLSPNQFREIRKRKRSIIGKVSRVIRNLRD